MELFVGNLPEGISPAELDVLFLCCRPMRWRLARGYAVATVIPDRLALRAVQQLHGRPLRGRPIEVREFLPRDVANERRGRHHRVRSWSGRERRYGERRHNAPPLESDRT
ncbi:hypothetical protein [Sulfurivermis fontis]|uniref:hypothetical protein n=1 Tax=Sulfurivermis fontis TaxID=1972068 RepID=UPI000FDB08EB|nr:hypothetical protein [Sulfurivermis fontis]